MRFLSDLARLNARRFPNKTALDCAGRHLSFGEMDQLANRIANRLLATGIAPGDRVAMLAFNCLEFMPTYFGIAKAGAISVPLNFRCTEDELAYMLSDCGAKALFYSPELGPIVTNLAARLPGLGLRIGFATGGAAGFDAFAASAAPDDPRISVDERQGAAILYTSGTTGRPKGVVLSHRAAIETTSCIAQATHVRHDDIVLVTVPLFHGGGLMVLTQPHLYLGATAVVMPRFDPAETLQTIIAKRVTTFFGVPSQYGMLLALPDAKTYGSGALKAAWYGAAAMPIELLRRALEFWPGVGFYQLYGQTETTLNTVLDPDEHRTKFGTTGRELPGIELRVVDDHDNDVAAGEVGEIIVRRDYGMTEYFGNPAATAEAIRGDWIYTGDLARIDAERYITVVDRKRDMIISGGENVYPKEIEDIVYQHPAIAECAVIGVLDERWGEVPVGFAALRKGQALTDEVLVQWCTARLARFKIPRRWIFVDELPKTANGKIRKTELRAKAREQAREPAGMPNASGP